MSAAIFKEPLELEDVLSALADDKFISLVLICAGMTDRWRACVSQVPALFNLFREAKLPDGPVYELAAQLFLRAGVLRDREAQRLWMAHELHPLVDVDKINEVIARLRPPRPAPGERVWL